MKPRRRIPPGLFIFGLIAVVASAGFVRLGIWQMDRHREVRRENNAHAMRMALEPVGLDASLLQVNEVDSLYGRRVEIAGRWDFDREVIIRSRARTGAPGVHVVTPLMLEMNTTVGGGETISVLVLRGWLPSPDATTTLLESARADRIVSRSVPRLALVRESRAGHGEPRVDLTSGDVRIASYAAIDVALIAGGESSGTLPFFLQLLPDDAIDSDQAGQPYPVPLPALGNGPHLVYMIQWFCFALITIIGSATFLRREVRRRVAAAAGRPDSRT